MKNTAICYRHFGLPEETLKIEHTLLPPCPADTLRVRMLCAPVNASDLIPVTGAYSHRITPPVVAGYEGVGMVISAPQAFSHLTGKRVLPLRGAGTWQTHVDCDPTWAIPVPDEIDIPLAARAYINPMAALLMLQLYPPTGKRVLLTAAGSDCALLLGQWALRMGAVSVAGVHRSAVHAQRLIDCGITPVSQQDVQAVERVAGRTDLVFDATGGLLAESLLQTLPDAALFICYGLLSGQPFRQTRRLPRMHWFHIRNYLDELTPARWQPLFSEIWALLKISRLGGVRHFSQADWQEAIAFYRAEGRTEKPMLVMSEIEQKSGTRRG